MRKIRINKFEYTFTDKEVNVINKCIIYSMHRLACHGGVGIHKALSKVERIALTELRFNLRDIK